VQSKRPSSRVYSEQSSAEQENGCALLTRNGFRASALGRCLLDRSLAIDRVVKVRSEAAFKSQQLGEGPKGAKATNKSFYGRGEGQKGAKQLYLVVKGEEQSHSTDRFLRKRDRKDSKLRDRIS